MSCTGMPDCNCGCCAGTSVQTPQPRVNPPGLPSVGYRIGNWASFKESMLARLSSRDYPALAALKTREDDDFTIALLDAAALVLDILTFYQERLANESYLRTAVQLRSLTELSRLIGYQPSPGVSASTYVAFTLKSAPGQPPDPTATAITISAGTQIQSVPPQGQTAQTFETSSDITAKPDWNALPVLAVKPWVPPGSSNSVYLSGTTTQLQPGDALLILGVQREEWSSSGNATPSDQWRVVVLNKVTVDTQRQLTLVSWDSELSHGEQIETRLRILSRQPRWTTAKVFAFRQKASLFGHNAPNPNLFVNASTTKPSTSLINATNPTSWQWNNFQIASPDQIDLDAAYPKIVAGSWFVLTSFAIDAGGVERFAQLYRVTSAKAVSLSNFALSGKVTELAADFQDPAINPGPASGNGFTLTGTEVWAQSDQLTVAEQPLDYPLYGTLIDLEDWRPDLLNATVIAISGVSQKISVNDGVLGLQFVPDDSSASPVVVKPGDIFVITDPTPLPIASDGTISSWINSFAPTALKVADASGRTGTLQGTGGTQLSLSLFSLAPSSSSDPEISEYAMVSSMSNVASINNDPTSGHTRIQLKSALQNCYDRAATTINANVALATHGQSVSEIMGSGSAATPNQSFTLKQSPLTYVQAATATGRQSTLQVQVNGVAWSMVPSLYQEGPADPVFAALNQSDGTTDILFGDGDEGATLPTGQNNIQANYRIGLGSSGNVAANSVTTLIDRPLGVSGVTNPQAATGGQDPQSVNDIRSNAPLTVLTLGRAVSLEDYENYASTFAGIAKAHAIWIPSGPSQGVFLTVAAADGSALPSDSPTIANLLVSLQNYGNPLIPITVQSFLETTFGLTADLQYDPAYSQPAVQAQVLQTLSQKYGFAQRDFGQGVSVDQVTAVIQAVDGVIAVNVKQIYTLYTSAGGDLGRSSLVSLARFSAWRLRLIPLGLSRPPSASPVQINAYLPVASSQTLPQPAEILVLDPSPTSVVLGVMS